MKKTTTIFVVMLMIFGFNYTVNAQETAEIPKETKSVFEKENFNTELTLLSRNVFRGVSYGESPSIFGKGAWLPCKYFEMGVYGNVTLNGTTEGYGNQFNYYFTLKPFANSSTELKNISITSDDYFYFNSNDDDNNWTDYDSDKTQHFLEARAKYDGEKMDLTAAYTYYSNKEANVDGIYFEAGYDISKTFNVFVGYLTDQNDIMFQEDAGISNIGFTMQRKLNIQSWSPDMKVSTIFSPMYDTVYEYPGVGRKPVYLVVSLTF